MYLAHVNSTTKGFLSDTPCHCFLVQIILFDEKQSAFHKLVTLRGHASTILSIRFLPVPHKSTCPKLVSFISGGTDGKLLFWDVTPLMCVH